MVARSVVHQAVVKQEVLQCVYDGTSAAAQGHDGDWRAKLKAGGAHQLPTVSAPLVDVVHDRKPAVVVGLGLNTVSERRLTGLEAVKVRLVPRRHVVNVLAAELIVAAIGSKGLDAQVAR